MAKSRSDAEARGCVKVNGREYVNSLVFAQRVGVTKQAICRYVREGKLVRERLEGYKGDWLDWSIARATFDKLRRNPKSGGSRIKKDAKLMLAAFGTGTVSDLKVPLAGNPADIEVPDLPKDAEEVLAYFDPEAPENADCWETDAMGVFLTIPNTNPPRHYIDWKKAIEKCTANIRYQQYQEKAGELIPRKDVLQALTRIFPPVSAKIMQMPDKFASRINSRVEEMTGRPLTNEEKTVIKALMMDEAEAICHNLQDAVDKALTDE